MCPRRGGFSGILPEGGGVLRLCVEGVKFSGPLPLCQRGGGMELSGSLPRGDSRGLCQRGGFLGSFPKGCQRVGNSRDLCKRDAFSDFFKRDGILWVLEKG